MVQCIADRLAACKRKPKRYGGDQEMLEVWAAALAGTPDEVGMVGALLTGLDGGLITGSDFLMWGAE